MSEWCINPFDGAEAEEGARSVAVYRLESLPESEEGAHQQIMQHLCGTDCVPRGTLHAFGHSITAIWVSSLRDIGAVLGYWCKRGLAVPQNTHAFT